MKPSPFRIIGFVLTLLACGGLAFTLAKPDAVPEPIKARLSADSGLTSFEFLGCSGNWMIDNPVPQVWLAGSTRKATFLVRHPATCGYTAGIHPRARVSSGELHLDYEPVNEGDDLAACLCEYWASFSLKSVPDKIVRVTFAGKEAQMMGHLAERR
jgi:hypothetical protein